MSELIEEREKEENRSFTVNGDNERTNGLSLYIKTLNKTIKKHFPHLTTIKKDFHITYSGIQRLVMLDRYAQKDKDLISLETGDLVILVVKPDPKFPSRGLGFVRSISDNKVFIEIEDEYLASTQKKDLIDGKYITKEKGEIDKPLEIFYEQIADRVARKLASVEKKEDQELWKEKFYNELSNKRLVPAGRVLYGAGSGTNVTYFNCFVMPYVEDSRAGISRHREEVMEIMSRGGGVGTNGSTLRPRHTQAKGVGGRSSGAVSWLNDLARLTHLVEQGGSRRGAQMIMLADWHPDILEFIISKMQRPDILSWLNTHSKDSKIRILSGEKLVFKPLNKIETLSYENILSSEEYQAQLTPSELTKVRNLIRERGSYELSDNEQLTGANISIAISDAFMKAIKENGDWYLKFPDIENYSKEDKEYYDKHWQECGDIFEWETKHKKTTKIYYKLRARVLWDLINFCATYSAEPGIFFLDRANKMTNAKAYGMKVVVTNPCGEQPLPPYSVCNLSAINLAQFVDKETNKIMYKELEDTVRIATRFQDNIIDATPYFLEANRVQAMGERRVGMGVMGLHDMLIWSKNKYASKKSLKVIDEVFKTIALTAYDESTNLAKEKGSFPFLSSENKEREIELRKRFTNTGFVKTLTPEVRKKILKNGIRNSHLLTVAPTGTTGTMIGVSTGLEPYFAFEYYRSGRLGNMIKVQADIVREYIDLNCNVKQDNLPDIFVSANDLSPEEHVIVQATIQRWVDSSISKTVNAPKGFTVKQVEKIYEMLYETGAKGGTVYVDGSRTTQVLSISDDFDVQISEQLHLEETQVITKKQIEKELDVSYRGDRQDREIGINPGNLCPLCSEGIIVMQGGCATCTNCNAQLKCDV